MITFRQERGPEDDFTMVANQLFDDPNIPLAAKGLYGYMRRHRDGWVMTTERIAKANGVSKNTAAKYINVLIEAGYIVRNQINENGQFGGVEYLILALPCPKNWDTVSESANSQVVPYPKKPYNGETVPRKTKPYNKTNNNKTNLNKTKRGLEGVEEPVTTGLEPEQETQSPPQSLDELASMHAEATSDDVCPQHPHGNPDNVPCYGCRQVRLRRQEEIALREAERKGAVVREIRERIAKYTPPEPLTVDKYPPGVGDVVCPGCGAARGTQCVHDGKPRMTACGARFRAGRTHSPPDGVDNHKQ